jgi:bis(5'-nucleosidyl)-tetraphosphatase
MPSEKSCGALIFRDDGGKRLYLILHYTGGNHDFPKGHVEQGESEEQTARREIEEETGITSLEFIPLFRERVSYSFYRSGELVPKHVVFFLAKTGEKEVRLSCEHMGFEWLESEEAKKRVTYGNARKLLEKAEAHLSSASP